MPASIQEYRFVSAPKPVMGFRVTRLHEFFTHFSDIITVTHRTNFFKLFWFTQGEVDVLIDFQKFRVAAPSLLFVSDRQVFSLTNFSKIGGYGLFFLPQFLPQSLHKTLEIPLIELYTAGPISHLDTQEEKFVSSTLDNMLEKQQREDVKYSEGILKHLLSALLLDVRRIITRTETQSCSLTEERELYKKFVLLLEKNFSEFKEANVFADLLHITPKRLNQVTRAAAGLNATTIISNRIILEAKRQLLHSTLSVKEIGYHLGFTEASNFTKYFKKHEAISPRGFRALRS